MKSLLSLIFSLSTIVLMGQVTGVDYLMKYNCDSDQYDVSIIILDGSATSIPHRAQFNCQISIVIPAGETVQITDEYMPLVDNQIYTGITPIDWRFGGSVLSPTAQPENDFYSIIPTLAPPGFYNNVETNEIVPLFSFIVGTSGEYNEDVRFFENGVDPSSTDPGMGGGNFNNGFTMGGPNQLYNGNVVESCITNTEDKLSQQIKIFPSPFQEKLTIELENTVKSIAIFNNNGQVFYQLSNNLKETISINTNNYPNGIYFVRVEDKNGIISNKKVVKL